MFLWVCRAQSVAMDNLFLECSWDTGRSLETGAMLVTGLLLEGALILSDSLEMTHPDSPSVSETPLLKVAWKPKVTAENLRLFNLQIVSVPTWNVDQISS